MPIDWGMIKGQPVGGVVGSVAPVPATPDAGLEGLMTGIGQGQQMAATAQAMEFARNQEARVAGLYPGQQQLQQQAIEAGQMGLDAAKQERLSAQQKKEAFQKDFDTGMSWLKQNKPDEWLASQKSMADTKLALANAADKMADTKIKAPQIYTNMAATGANMAVNAMEAEKAKPGSGQVMWDQSKKYLGEDLASLYPQEFNVGTYLTMMKLGTDATLQLQEEQQNKNLPEATQTLNSLQAKRNKLEKQLADSKKSGSDTKQIERDLTETQDLINTKTSNKSTVVNTSTVATGEKIKVDAEGLKDAQKTSRQVTALNPVLDKVDKLVNEISDMSQGPIAGNLSSIWNTKVQELDQTMGLVVSALRQIMSFPAAGFSDADRQMLEKVAASKFKDKSANIEAVKLLRTIVQRAQDSADQYRADYDKQYGTEDTTLNKEEQAPATPSINPIQEEMKKRGLKIE